MIEQLPEAWWLPGGTEPAQQAAALKVVDYEGVKLRAGWAVSLRSHDARRGGRWRLPAAAVRAAARRCAYLCMGADGLKLFWYWFRPGVKGVVLVLELVPDILYAPECPFAHHQL